MAKVISIANDALKTGDLVPETALYTVVHSAHSLPAEVTLRKGQRFPRCEACEEPVAFRLRRKIADSAASSVFRVELYQLPVQSKTSRAS